MASFVCLVFVSVFLTMPEFELNAIIKTRHQMGHPHHSPPYFLFQRISIPWKLQNRGGITNCKTWDNCTYFMCCACLIIAINKLQVYNYLYLFTTIETSYLQLSTKYKRLALQMFVCIPGCSGNLFWFSDIYFLLPILGNS